MGYKKRGLTPEGEIDNGIKEEEVFTTSTKAMFSADMILGEDDGEEDVEGSTEESSRENVEESVADSGKESAVESAEESVEAIRDVEVVLGTDESEYYPKTVSEVLRKQSDSKDVSKAENAENEETPEDFGVYWDISADEVTETTIDKAEEMSEEKTDADSETEPGIIVAESINNEAYSVDSEHEEKKKSTSKEKSEEADSKPKKKKKKKTVIIIPIIIIVAVLAIAAALVIRVRIYDKEIAVAAKCLEEEKPDDAIVHYNKALSVMRNSSDAYLGLAESYIAKGELEAAIEILDEGIAKTGSENLIASKAVIYDQVFATYVLSEYVLNLLPGETAQLTVNHRAQDLGFDITYRSDDDSIATVSEDGLVTAVKNGNVTIFANVGNEKWGYRDINCELTVGVIVTFLEEMGCDYVEKGGEAHAPAYVFQADEYGLLIDGGTLKVNENDADYLIDSVTVSDPDVDGNVTYTITAKIYVNKEFGIVLDSYEAEHEWYYDWTAEHMQVGDEYTGTMFAVQNLFGHDYPVIDSTVSYNDFTYHIQGSVEESWEDTDNWKLSLDEEGTTWAKAPGIGTFIYKIAVPKEYQGLCFVVDKAGITEYVGYGTLNDYDSMELDEESTDNTSYVDVNLFNAEEYGATRTGSDFYVFRLSDYLEQ